MHTDYILTIHDSQDIESDVHVLSQGVRIGNEYIAWEAVEELAEVLKELVANKALPVEAME